MKLSRIFECVAVALFALTEAVGFAAPAIIPLPQQLQLRSGSFTLCPQQSISGSAALAPTRILVDPVTEPTGRYLAELLLKSTGFQFQIEPYAGTMAIKDSIVLS